MAAELVAFGVRIVLFYSIFSGHTVFVSPPLPDESQDPSVSYIYGTFPSHLNEDLFPPRDRPPGVELGQDTPAPATDSKTFIARRSKAEAKASLKVRFLTVSIYNGGFWPTIK